MYDKELHEVQNEIKDLETSLETLQNKVSALHITRETLEIATLQSRMESLAILEEVSQLSDLMFSDIQWRVVYADISDSEQKLGTIRHRAEWNTVYPHRGWQRNAQA